MNSSYKTLSMMIAMGLPAQAQSGPASHYALTSAVVAQALSNNGTPTAGDQVSLPATVVATEPSPALDIMAVESVADVKATEARSRIKLACRLPGACLPFYALVTRPQTRPQTASDDIASSKPKVDIIMRAGTPATLILDDKRAHIKLAVVSLESGAAGKWIRVASPNHKQIYHGEIISANLLRGAF